MNFLFSNNNDDDDNFDSFITQNLKPEPPRGAYESHKKQLTTFTQIGGPTQLQFLNSPKSPQEEPAANQVNIWELALSYLECKLPLNNLETLRQQFPYPMNQFYLSKVQEFKNQKLDAIICEVQFIEEYGDTQEVLLKDQTGQCKASMLSEMIIDQLDDEEPKIHYPVTVIQKKDKVLLYLENVTVFAPNDFEISMVINRNNIKFAAF